MNNRKVYISPRQYGIIRESEWNLHYGGGSWRGDGKEHTLEPHYSDNKFNMVGRDTGHFGSGTYFSTYNFSKSMREPLENSMDNEDPHFIKIGDGVYRVDFDLYKNLYKVRSEKQGDMLFTMMENLNNMYNKICQYRGRFEDGREANYNNARNYQIISRNARALGLRCPSYYQLTRMAQEHGKNDEAVQSFSTLFMEWNGYNGVNVSGIERYDNTLHGSVIYDLSKVNTDMEQVNPTNLFAGFGDSMYNNTIAADSFSDDVHDSLRGKDLLWGSKLNEMPLPQAMRLLKNYTDYGNILSSYTIGKLNPDLAKRYLRLIYVKNPSTYWTEGINDIVLGGNESKYYIKLIDKYGAYYWVNYYDERSHKGYTISGLESLLSNFANNLNWWNYNSNEEIMAAKREYYEKLMSYMQRDLTEYEKQYINEDYFYVDDEQ